MGLHEIVEPEEVAFYEYMLLLHGEGYRWWLRPDDVLEPVWYWTRYEDNTEALTATRMDHATADAYRQDAKKWVALGKQINRYGGPMIEPDKDPIVDLFENDRDEEGGDDDEHCDHDLYNEGGYCTRCGDYDADYDEGAQTPL